MIQVIANGQSTSNTGLDLLPVPIGVSPPTSGAPYDHTSAGLVNGGAVLVWYEQSTDSAPHRILARLVDQNGAPGDEIVIWSGADNSSALQPRVAALAGGGFVVGYEYSDSSTNGWETRNQIVRADGTLGTDAIFAMSGTQGSVTTSNNTFPAIAGLADGGFVTVVDGTVTDLSSQTTGLIAARFDSAGNPVPIVSLGSIDPTTGGGYTANRFPQVAGLAAGGYVVTWFHSGDFDPALGDRPKNLHGQTFDATGQPVGAQFDLGILRYPDQREVAVTGLNDGRFVVAWSDGSNDTSHVRFQLFGADGAAVGAQVLVDSHAGDANMFPAIAALAGGGFVVGWSEAPLGGATSFDIHARAFDATGAPVSAETVLAATTSTEWHVSAATLAGGKVLIGWEGEGNGQNNGIDAEVVSLNSGPDALTLRVSADAYQGYAQFIVKVDGQQVGSVQTVTASHAAGEYQDMTIHGTFGPTPGVVSVQFLNDSYSGPGQDRNLYVQSMALNGQTYRASDATNGAGYNTATEAVLISNGTLTFDATPQRSLTLHLSEDAFAGDAQFVVLVDGQQVGGVQTASASHGVGGSQAITILGHFSASPNTVSVQFLNDSYGGPGQDRNLYVESLDLNGQSYRASDAANGAGYNTPTEAVMITNGTLTFDTSRSLVLRVSEDAYQGHAQFIVTVDGQQVGGVQTVTASHGTDPYQDIAIQGNFGAGLSPLSVGVQFINDLYGGSAAQDRNLYVDQLTLNGKVFQAEAAANGGGYNTSSEAVMITSGTLTFDTNPVARPLIGSHAIDVVTSAGDIPLGITVSLADPTETLGQIRITLPSSFALSAGTPPGDGSGTWVLSADQLPGLALRPAVPGNAPTGDFTLTVSATATQGGGSATAQQVIPVTIEVPAGTPTGTVADGYVAGATVFADTNRNGVLDGNEVSTKSLADGSFTLVGAPTDAPIVMTGGVDVSTGLAFIGKLSAPAGSSVVTPLTTLVAQIAYGTDPSAPLPTAAQIAQAQSTVKTALGLGDVDLTTYDAIAQVSAGGAGAQDAAHVLSAAIQVQTTIAQISAVTSDTAAAVTALVSAVTSAGSGGSPAIVDLTNSTVVTNVATASGVSADALQVVTGVVAAANGSIADAVTANTTAAGSGTDLLTGFSKAATVALGDTTDALKAAAQVSDPAQQAAALQGVQTSYTGTNLSDTVTATPASVVTVPIIGTLGNDTIVGTAGADAIDGRDGDDTIDGGAGNDQIFGGEGRDRITGGAGNNVIDGGSGSDTAVYANAGSGITVSLAAGTVTFAGTAQLDTLRSVEGIRGTAFADTFDAHGFGSIATDASPNASGSGLSVTGGLGPQNGFNEFEGGGGDDVVIGSGSTRLDFRTATAGVTVSLSDPTAGVAGSTGTARSTTGETAGIGHDIVMGGVNAIWGSDFDDVLVGSFNPSSVTENFDGGAGNDDINGAGGYDRARYDKQVLSGTQGITVLLAQGKVTGPVEIGTDTLHSIEAIRGTNNADTFDARGFAQFADSNNPQNINFGTDQGNFNEFEGLGGDDTIYGNGNTRLNFANSGASVTVDLQLATAGQTGSTGRAVGAATGTDTIFGGVTSLRGSNFNDTLLGTDSTSVTDQFEGWAGDDFIDGRGGFDRVRYDNSYLAGSGVDLTSGVNIQMAAGTVTGRDALALTAFGTDTLRAIESVRGSASADIYNAVGFGNAGALNVGSNGTFNEFEGMGGDDLVIGNGNTRLMYQTALAGVTVDLSTGNPNVAGSTGTAHGTAGNDAAGIGFDTIMGGISQVRGSQFADTITGGSAAEIFTGGAGNDAINGGGGIDTAIFSGTRAQYVITPDPNVGGSAVIQDTIAGRDDTDTVTGIELLEFTDQIAKNQRVLDLTGFGLTAGKTLTGGSNPNGDDLTIGQNANGRLIDLLGGGTDVLKLGTAGVFYTLNIQNVEQLLSLGTGNENVTLVKSVTAGTAPGGLFVDLGAGSTDFLKLADGSNSLTVQNVETVFGGLLYDTLTLATTGSSDTISIKNIESVIGTNVADTVVITTDPGTTNLSETLALGGGSDTVSLNAFGVTSAFLTLTGVETIQSQGGVGSVTLTNAAQGMSIDLGTGIHTLSLSSSGDNNVTVSHVQTLNIFGTSNDIVNFTKDPASLSQTISLGLGTDTLNLRGSDGDFSLSVFANQTSTVYGQTTAVGGEHVTLLNQQAGTIYDLGAGTNDSLTLANTAGINVVYAKNIETVTGSSAPDQIHILGNSAATTVVKGGVGADQIWAGPDTDRFVFTALTDSSPGVGHDMIMEFNANQDVLDFRGLNITNWDTTISGNVTFLHLYASGHTTADIEVSLVSPTGHAIDTTNLLFV